MRLFVILILSIIIAVLAFGQTNQNIHFLKQQLLQPQSIIKNDFVVNDDTVGCSNNNLMNIAMDTNGNYVVLYLSELAGASQLFFTRYASDGAQLGEPTKVSDLEGYSTESGGVIKMDAEGNFMIAWFDTRMGETNWKIFFQRYTKDGVKLGANTQLKVDVSNVVQRFPSLSVDKDGGFIIAWIDARDGIGYNVFYQRYSKDGSPIGNNIKVNQDVSFKDPVNIAAAMDKNKNVLIAWHEARSASNPLVYIQRFDGNGVAIGNNTLVITKYPEKNNVNPVVAMEPNGSFIVVWEMEIPAGANLFFQRFSSSGEALGLNTTVLLNANPKGPATAVIDTSGAFAFSWVETRSTLPNVFLRQFNNDGTPASNEIKVFECTSQNMYSQSPRMAMDTAGNYLVLWEQDDSTGAKIKSIRYDTHTLSLDSIVDVAAIKGTRNQTAPQVAVAKNGMFIVAWNDLRVSKSLFNQVFAQLYGADGNPIGENYKVTNDLENVGSHCVGIDSLGNYVISYNIRTNTYDNYIYCRRYSNTGALIGDIIVVTDDTKKKALCISNTIKMFKDGSFIAVWSDNEGGVYNCYYQLFDKNGGKIGTNRKVTDVISEEVRVSPAIGICDDNSFAIVWYDQRNNTSDIYMRLFASDGSPIGADFKVNDLSTIGYEPAIAMLPSGDFIVAWQDQRFDNINFDIFMQRYSKIGERLGDNYRINEDESGIHGEASVVANESGEFSIFWTDYGDNLQNPDLYAQKFDASGNASGGNFQAVADGPNYQESIPFAGANNDKIVLTWVDNRRTKGWDIFGKIVTWDWSGESDGVDDGSSVVEFALDQNYPNPFNPSTMIRYKVAKASRVSIKVFDLLGRQVAVVFEGNVGAGIYEIPWTAKKLPSGMYLYQITAESNGKTLFSQTKKLMLIK